MSAIVDHNINARYIFLEIFPERSVGLVSHKYLGLAILVSLAFFVDVDAVDSAFGTEIFLPHVQTATAKDSDLYDVHLLPHELLKIAVIDVEVVQPLQNPPPFLVRFKVEP